jgi:hypothetical protein
MSKLSSIAASALFLVSATVLPSLVSAAETTPGISGRDAAASECLSFNKYGPAQLVSAVEDGLGDWVVWVRDKDDDLWICNASAEGNVYVNTMIRGDLLAGAGVRASAIQPIAHNPASAPSALEGATRLCAAAGRHVGADRVVINIPDGVGDRIVWLQDADNSYWLCTASADAKLFVFERVRSPLNQGAAGPSFRAA